MSRYGAPRSEDSAPLKRIGPECPPLKSLPGRTVAAVGPTTAVPVASQVRRVVRYRDHMPHARRNVAVAAWA